MLPHLKPISTVHSVGKLILFLLIFFMKLNKCGCSALYLYPVTPYLITCYKILLQDTIIMWIHFLLITCYKILLYFLQQEKVYLQTKWCFHLYQEGDEKYQLKLKEATWVPHLFRVSVSQTEYMNEKRQRITVRAQAPLDCSAESRYLLEEIAKMSIS